MTGFWALARKEVLEQRRTWKFLALVGVFTALALLTAIIPFIVTEVRDEPQDVQMAHDLLRVFGFTTVGLGSLLAIFVAMGSLANERASGTAAMTLSKPVTRSAFVAAKFLGIVFSIFAALGIASAVMFVLTLVLIDDGGLAGFTRYMATIGVYLVFIGSIAFFWSGMFSRQLLAGGIALVLFIAFIPLSEIPRTQRYWPINTVDWAERNFSELGEQSSIDEIIVPNSSGAGVRLEGRGSFGEGAVVVERVGGPAISYQRFQQLRVELADVEDIDGLTPRIVTSALVENPESGRRGHVRVLGIDPLFLEGFGSLTFTSGGEARLEDLAEDQVYISKSAARELDTKAGDRLLLADITGEGIAILRENHSAPDILEDVASDEGVTINVRGVVKPGSLVGFGEATIIMPLQRAQAMFRLDDQISDILVSNRGGEAAGGELSEEVTRKLRVLFTDREVAAQLKELLNQDTVLKALERREKSLGGGNVRRALSRLRGELQRADVSDVLTALLSEASLANQVIEALERDGLSDVAVEARTLYSELTELQVIELNRRFNEASDRWPAFFVALGLIGVLSVGAWGVFRKKEL